MVFREAWVNERLQEGKPTGNAVLTWTNTSGEKLRFKCITGRNSRGELIGRVLVSVDHLVYRSCARRRVLCVGNLVFPGSAEYEGASKRGLLSEYSIDCDGVLGYLLLPDSKHLLNLASCSDRKCDANATLSYDRRFKSVSLKQTKTIKCGDQIKFWYGDEFGKRLKQRS